MSKLFSNTGMGKRSVKRRKAVADFAVPTRFEAMEKRVLFAADTVILGDYNGSGQVEQGDLDLVLSNWGKNFVSTGQAVPSAWTVDLPTDQVEQSDLDAVLSNWGTLVPGNSMDGRVQPLVSGQTFTTQLGNNSDVDTYSIHLNAGDSLLLTMQENANTFSYMEATLFGPDNIAVQQVSFQTGGELDQINVTQTGTYKLVINDYYGNASGAYSLTAVVIDNTLDVDNVALTSGQTVVGNIGVGDIDTFTIDADAGESLLVSIRENANTFSYMEAWLFAPDGSLVQRVSFQTGDDLDQVNLTQSGRYTIAVNDYYHGSTGAYSLTAVVADNVVDADNVALNSGQTVTGTLGLGDIDTFTIDADAGESLLVSIRENANTFSYLEAWLFAPDGSLVQRVDFQVGDDLDQINLTQSGRYTIAVNDFYNAATGDYSLTAVVADNVVDADNVALSSGQTVTGTLGLGDIDTFTINADAGDTLLVSVAEAAATFSYLEAWLFAPNGSLIQRVDFQAGDDLDQINLAVSGRYTIAVNDYYNASTGDYFLTAVVADNVIDADNVALSSGVSVGGFLTVADIDTFTINATAGQDLLISISEDANTFSYLEAWLFAPNGALIQRVDFQASGDLDQFNLAQTGRYTIAVNDYYNRATGSYTLTATAAFPPPITAGIDAASGLQQDVALSLFEGPQQEQQQQRQVQTRQQQQTPQRRQFR